ncbi:glycosyltransferase [Bizionia gelidisalsuginis]|uniref:Glycosyltransferase n=1 Tax=Bizionia gelidisalsuginis TaxID=291188 RepID=A0ABY3MDK9_9FLAO|nr:glycosyltransferase [Bizionia gelidisalsuginis]TYC17014.1 glycosyltransferase [Bizionia gelidisalsuginis]
MIPKIIHYCWFGKGKKSKLILDCLESWKNILEGYEIIEWNESNTDLLHPFVKAAYLKKEWAFVSDYVRLEKLYEFGGIYLDTDMLMLKNIDNFLEDECFFGAEDLDLISVGIIGAKPKNEFILNALLFYDSLKFNFENTKSHTIPFIVTKIFRGKNNFNFNFDSIIELDRVKIYPFDYFYPVNYHYRKDILNYKNYITKNTYGIHLWNSSWIEQSEFDYIRQRKYLKGFKKVLRNVKKKETTNLKYLRKILSCLKESLKNEKSIHHNNLL